MTARHIDATDKTDGSHVVKILWNENDSERELTVRMPAAGTDATDRVDVDLLPVPGENSATTMDDAVAALEGFLGNNKYIHIDGDDVRSVCAGALTTVIRVESGSSTGIVEALVGGVQKRLTDKVEIIWGLNFTDEDVLRATVLLAIQQK